MRQKKPLFVASGESSISDLFSSKFEIKKLNEYVSGVICVSSKNKEESINVGLTTENKCKVIPNAINPDIFFERDRQECRNHLGFSNDDFIIAFVGWFIDRKGPLRVVSAIEKIKGVKSIFIGKGDQEPVCDSILYKGTLDHNLIPIYLSAADLFVLPTLKEGCCNAVIEAMACGLPIVSSNLPFNWDVLNENNSIMVDPNNINEIANAIVKLRDDNQLRKELRTGAIATAKTLTIQERANTILKFIEEKCL